MFKFDKCIVDRKCGRAGPRTFHVELVLGQQGIIHRIRPGDGNFGGLLVPEGHGEFERLGIVAGIGQGEGNLAKELSGGVFAFDGNVFGVGHLAVNPGFRQGDIDCGFGDEGNSFGEPSLNCID